VEAERRQVTVLFADMVGFTTFSEQSGEEAAFTLMRSLSSLMDEAVREPGGVVQGFTGDGIMAVFGAPFAFEDAPLRACRAALSILLRLKVAGDDFEVKHGLRPRLRIGLSTGAAVVGRVQGGAEAGPTVLGDAVNMAARLQALAEPDSVFMSEATHRLVQGMVEASFVGEHQIKGKLASQRVYRLDAIRLGTTRFAATVSRGLGAFVGRERELEVLERGLDEARSRLCVIELVADPGMGKSRLLHEFRQRIGKERAFVLSGSCSPDGQQTSFLPFIEIVRSSFRVSAGEAEKEVAQKLEIGLTTLGLHSARNLGLLLHLLGLKVPDGALAGLDGLLIGLRTRELLRQLLEVRCRLSLVVMMIEDLHWIDGASEEVLGKIVGRDGQLRLLLLTTRRPEYVPPWVDRAVVAKLHLEPLPTGDIRRLVQTRFGVDALPEALAQRVTEKAEGNPLFAEEIVSYLIERGTLHAAAGKLHFDSGEVGAALPASVQSLLTARVDRLEPNDRVLLQAASVIGRRFDSQILAVAVGEKDVDVRLNAIQALELIRFEHNSGEFTFKHALVRDALYQSLLTEVRTALHAKIAMEIERRSSNRLAEVAEILAHHYNQTHDAGKAFAYLSMAGSKSLSVYALDAAARHFNAALSLLDKSPDCASDDQVAEFFVFYAPLLNMQAQVKVVIGLLERYLTRIDRLAGDPRAVVIRHHYIFALLWNARYRVAASMQQETSPIAERVGDSKSKAYALAGEILVSTIVAPKPLDEFEALKRAAIEAASDTADAYIQNWTRFVIGWEEFHRGRINEARDAAHELMQVGRLLNDPRSTGLGLSLLALITLLSDSYSEALEYAEQSTVVAVTPMDRETAINMKGCALVLLRRVEDGLRLLEEFCRRCLADGDLYSLTSVDGIIGVSKVIQGNIRYGIRLLEEAILRREKEGYTAAADWYRLNLAEVYLQILEGNEKLPFLTLLKNLPILLEVMLTASSRIRALMTRFLENPRFDPMGHHAGRAQMILGLLYKAKKKRPLAVRHLAEAKRILCQFGQTPMLARVEAALAELGP
jgi:class 3 adenylate cyclase/tetratricopeptide (TPR) repeat protein